MAQLWAAGRRLGDEAERQEGVDYGSLIDPSAIEVLAAMDQTAGREPLAVRVTGGRDRPTLAVACTGAGVLDRAEERLLGVHHFRMRQQVVYAQAELASYRGVTAGSISGSYGVLNVHGPERSGTAFQCGGRPVGEAGGGWGCQYETFPDRPEER